ncbi:MAG: cytochrome P450 [Chloroflexota bacterium]
MSSIAPQQDITCEHAQASMRKTSAPVDRDLPIYETLDDGTWVIRGFDEVRQILRSQHVKQAGFASETVSDLSGNVMQNQPILFLDGQAHHAARRETNRFFTPRVTDNEYRAFMSAYADDLVAQLKAQKRADLSDISMEMAVQVAAKIVGLTDSILPNGLKKRLEAMIDVGDSAINGEMGFVTAMRSQWSTLSFFLLDVLPAVRARRKEAQDDVISYLIEREYSALEIMTECIVYGVAGMVTTREFIGVALWHLFENPHLMERMKVGSEKERYAILHEILRLEPVVSHLYRRASEDLTFESNGETVTIPAGSRIDLHISVANVDSRAMGDDAEALCPMREVAEMRPKVPEFGLSFGDGAHRCPGAYVAIQETDIFLRKLLAVEGLRVEREPDVTYYKIAESYEIRNFILVVD